MENSNSSEGLQNKKSVKRQLLRTKPSENSLSIFKTDKTKEILGEIKEDKRREKRRNYAHFLL